MNLNNYTIGVEEEYMICNPADGELINKAEPTKRDQYYTKNNILPSAYTGPGGTTHLNSIQIQTTKQRRNFPATKQLHVIHLQRKLPYSTPPRHCFPK